MKLFNKFGLIVSLLGLVSATSMLPHSFTVINRVIVDGKYMPIWVDIYGVGSLAGTMFAGNEPGYFSWQGAGTLKGSQFLLPKKSQIFNFNSWDWGVCFDKILAGYAHDELVEVEVREIENAQLNNLESALNNLGDAIEKGGKAAGEAVALTPSSTDHAQSKEKDLKVASKTLDVGAKTLDATGAPSEAVAVTSGAAAITSIVAGGAHAIANPEAAAAAAAVQAATSIVADSLKVGTQLYKGSYCRNRTFTIIMDPNKNKLIAISRP